MLTSISTTITLDSTSDSQLTYTYKYYIMGSAVGLIILSTFNDFIFNKEMYFLPLCVFAAIAVVMSIVLVIFELFSSIDDPN